MGSKKRRVTAYLVDDVVESFDGFKHRHGLEADSQALNQILIQFFSLSEKSLPSSDVLARLAEVEKTLNLLRGVREQSESGVLQSSSGQLGLSLDEDLGLPVPEKEVAKRLNIPEKRLRSARRDKSEGDYNVWLAAASQDCGVRYVYSASAQSFFLCST
jgi:hypothetical protein